MIFRFLLGQMTNISMLMQILLTAPYMSENAAFSRQLLGATVLEKSTKTTALNFHYQ